MVNEKSSDYAKLSTYIEVCAEEDNILLAFSHWVLSLLKALALSLMLIFFFFKN